MNSMNMMGVPLESRGKSGSYIQTVSFSPVGPPEFIGAQPRQELIREVVDYDQVVRDYKNSSKEERKAISTLLRSAGYRVPVTSKYNLLVRDELINAYSDFTNEVESINQSTPEFLRQSEYNLTKFLKDKQVRGDSTGGPQTTRYRQDPTDEALARGINQVYEDLIGRGASKEEREKYAKRIRQELSKVENMASSTVTDLGGGVQQRTDRGGFDTEAFLYEQLGGSDEAKTRQVFNFYDAFKRTIGVQ
jgi:hypothetical protein